MLKEKILRILFETLFFLGSFLIVICMLSTVLLSDTLTLLEKTGLTGIFLFVSGVTGLIVGGITDYGATKRD